MHDNNADGRAHLQELHVAAEEFIGAKRFNTVQFFYRNKPDEYFARVKRHNHVMTKIKKDKTGDKRPPINSKLSGVFLGVTLSRGRLPTASPFGNTRIQFPIEAVFDSHTNLYFTDFYCTTSSQHYVTLVMTKPGTNEDDFCRLKCFKLDLENNTFLRMRRGFYGEPTMYSTIKKSGLIVEVFYTENIDIAQLIRIYGSGRVFYSQTEIIGRGTSTWGGLRKNTSCTYCNPSLRGTQTKEEPVDRTNPLGELSRFVYGSSRRPDATLSRSYSYPSVRYSRPNSNRPDNEPSIGTLGLLVGVGIGVVLLFGMLLSKHD